MELDREDLRLWLAAKEPDEVVGLAQNSEGCALASYLLDRTGVRWVVEPCTGYRRYDWEDATFYRMPDWGKPFTLGFDGWDETLGNSVREENDPVTAKDALTILDSIEVSS